MSYFFVLYYFVIDVLIQVVLLGFFAKREVQVRHFGLVSEVLIEDPHHLRLVVQLEKPFESSILLASFPEH